jgi:hypothetical protein
MQGRDAAERRRGVVDRCSPPGRWPLAPRDAHHTLTHPLPAHPLPTPSPIPYLLYHPLPPHVGGGCLLTIND